MKKVIWLIIVSIVLTSCGGVTPIASTAIPTSTSTTSPKIAPTTSEQPELRPTTSSTPDSFGPEFSPDKYRLRALSPDDYEAIFKYVDETRPGFMDSYQNGDKYLVAFNAERWLRSQEQERERLLLKILSYDPNGIPVPGMRPDQDTAVFAIEDSLNRQNIKIDQVADYLTNNQNDDFLMRVCFSVIR